MPDLRPEAWREHLKSTGFLGISQTYGIGVNGGGAQRPYFETRARAMSQTNTRVTLMNRFGKSLLR